MLTITVTWNIMNITEKIRMNIENSIKVFFTFLREVSWNIRIYGIMVNIQCAQKAKRRYSTP